MSRMAPFTDGGRTNDRTNWADTYISYYPFGGAIALALDLSLRGRSDGRVTLDDFMRAMWRVHGKPGGAREGYVDHPYTIDDAEQRLAEVSGDASFAQRFLCEIRSRARAPGFCNSCCSRRGLRSGMRTRAGRGGATFASNRATAGASPHPRSRIRRPTKPALMSTMSCDSWTARVWHPLTMSRLCLDVTSLAIRLQWSLSIGLARRRRAKVTLAADPQIELVAAESTGGRLSRVAASISSCVARAVTRDSGSDSRLRLRAYAASVVENHRRRARRDGPCPMGRGGSRPLTRASRVRVVLKRGSPAWSFRR